MPEAHIKPCYLRETPIEPKVLPMQQSLGLDNPQVTQIELAWLAGIIDGEGYIGIHHYKTRHNHLSVSAELQITNTDEPIILKSQNIIQKIGVNPYIRNSSYKLKNKPNHKNVWILTIHRLNKLVRVLSLVNPYLTGAKRERAELILEFCNSRLCHHVRGSQHNLLNAREMEIIELCITKQRRGTSETIRKAQLENSELNRQKSESRRNSTNGRYSHYSISDDIVQPFAKA